MYTKPASHLDKKRAYSYMERLGKYRKNKRKIGRAEV